MRWAPEQQPSLYAAAYGLYNQGDYQQSASLFTELVLSDALEVRHWSGLAAAQQMQSHFKEALHAWSIVALLAEEDPWPHFHAAECLLSLGEKEEGLKALDSALKKTQDDELLYSKIEGLKHYA